jgi:hypothetical protein
MISREPIMSALKQRLVENLPGFAIISRRFRMFGNCEAFPALFIVEPNETEVNSIEGLPAQSTLDVDLYIYLNVGLDPNVEPIVALNGLIDDVSAALSSDLPQPFDQVCTLGGLVKHCWIEGTLEKAPGDLDGQGMARIPLKISVP